MGAASAEAGQTLQVVAVEGEEELALTPNPDMPTPTPAPVSVPGSSTPEKKEDSAAEPDKKEDEAVESPKAVEQAEASEPPPKKAKVEGMSEELEKRYANLMQTATTGFECTREALNSVKDHMELLRTVQKDLSSLAAEVGTSRISEKYYLTQLQQLYNAFSNMEWQLTGPKAESHTSLKSMVGKTLGATTSVKEGLKVLFEELKSGQNRTVEAIEKGFGSLCEAIVRNPIPTRDGTPGAASTDFPPSVPPMPTGIPPMPSTTYGLPGYANTGNIVPPPVAHVAPMTPRMSSAAMGSVGQTGATGSVGATIVEGAEPRAPMVLITQDQQGTRRRIAVSPTRHASTQHLSQAYAAEFNMGFAIHNGYYHRRLPEVFLPKEVKY